MMRDISQKYLNTDYTTQTNSDSYKESVKYATLNNNNTITLFGLNTASIRAKVTNPLPLHTEHEIQNRPSYSFQFSDQEVETKVTVNNRTTYYTWYDLIIEASENTESKYCPEGYRLPNQRELILMATCGNLTNTATYGYMQLLSKTLSSYFYQPNGNDDYMPTEIVGTGPSGYPGPGYWVGGYILNRLEGGVTLNPGSWYYGQEVEPNDTYNEQSTPNYHIRCVRDLQ